MVSVLIWFAFQTLQLVVERNNLTALKANFDSAMQESQKMQSQLQSLVSKTLNLRSRAILPPRRRSKSSRRGEFRSKGPLLSLPNELVSFVQFSHC